MPKLNIGCGPYPIDGYINIDKNPRWKPDVVCDVRKGLPYEDSSIDEIWASHFCEHLTYDEFMDFMDEAWRVLKKGSRCVITVPLNERATIDHKMTLSEGSLDFLGTEEGRTYHNRNWNWDFKRNGITGSHNGYDIMQVTVNAIK